MARSVDAACGGTDDGDRLLRPDIGVGGDEHALLLHTGGAVAAVLHQAGGAVLDVEIDQPCKRRETERAAGLHRRDDRDETA